MKIKDLVVSSVNVRIVKNNEDVSELKDSIKKFSLLSKIILRSKNDGFEIIAGQRRYLALKDLYGSDYDLPETDYIIMDNLSDKEALLLSLSENQHRVNLSPMELNTASLRLNQMGVKDKDIARALCITPHRLKRIFNLGMDKQKMPEIVKEELQKTEGSKFTDLHWDYVRDIEEPDIIKEVADYVIEKESPAKEVPLIVKSIQKAHGVNEKNEPKAEIVGDNSPVQSVEEGPAEYSHKGQLLLEESEGRLILKVVGPHEEKEVPVKHYLEYLRFPEKFRCYVTFKLKVQTLE